MPKMTHDVWSGLQKVVCKAYKEVKPCEDIHVCVCPLLEVCWNIATWYHLKFKVQTKKTLPLENEVSFRKPKMFIHLPT